MIANESCRGEGVTTPRHASRATAFTLIELLTVVFIISLLIGLLIPSINAARNAAKKLTTSKTMDAVKVGLEMFKNDNGPDFRQTNGYPPSFAHPPIPGYDFAPYRGQFPFIPDVPNANPTVYGAHWLPAMLMGVDNLGYVKRSTVPTADNLRNEPWRWYTPDPLNEGRPLERQPLYLDPGNVKTLATEKLPGKRPESSTDPPIFPNWDNNVWTLPVIVDAFDQPILYYVANTHGQVTNMVGGGRNENNIYSGGNQERGVPFYFHQDNIGFTGDADNTQLGWDFGSHQREHAISRSGAELIGSEIAGPANRETFARYIVDRKLYESLSMNLDANAPVRPVNADSYLLISAGPDGLYGTNDDVNNMPPWPD